MAGTLRLTNTGAGSQTTLTAAGTADRTLTLPDTDGTLVVNVNNQVAMPSGTAAAPGLSVEADANTGLFSPAADTLAISTAGTEKLRVTNDGRLLINDPTDSTAIYLMARGNPGGGAGGVIGIKRNNNTPGSEDNIGSIQMYAANGDIVGRLQIRRDNGTWTPGTSQPTAFEIRTTRDGSQTIEPNPVLTCSSRGGVTARGIVGPDFVNEAATNTLSHLLTRSQTQCMRIGTISSTTAGVFDIGRLGVSDYHYEVVMIGGHNSSNVNCIGSYLITTRTNSTNFQVRTVHENITNGSVAFAAHNTNILRMTITNTGGTAYRNLAVTVRSNGPNSTMQYIAMDSTLAVASPS